MPLTTDRMVRADSHTNNTQFTIDATLEYNGKRYFAVRNDFEVAEFRLVEALEMTQFSPSRYGLYPESVTGVIYQPLEEGTVAEDVMGATHAHDDGTHWSFGHSTKKGHHSMARVVSAVAGDAFQCKIEEATIARFGADASGVTATQARLENLIAFKEDVRTAALTRFFGEVVGHYHRNPHDGHYLDITVQSINSVVNIWTGSATRKARLPSIQNDIDDVLSELNTVWPLQTRAEKAAADAAEKKKPEEAAEAETPAE